MAWILFLRQAVKKDAKVNHFFVGATPAIPVTNMQTNEYMIIVINIDK
jgi:hypothetical protein